MKSNTIAIILFLILLFIAPMVKCGNEKVIEYINKTDTVKMSDTVFVEETDTLYLTKPTLVEKEIIRVDTVKENTELIVENKVYKDTLCNEQDSLIVMNTIQGINANLLSTEAIWKKQNTIVTNTVEVTKYKNQKGLIITPQIGVGYGIFNKKADIFVGIGLSYKF